MGFLLKAAKGQDGNDMSGFQEESYERLFPKIGRDFVSKEDFYKVMRQLMYMIDPSGSQPIDYEDDSEAKRIAFEYKSNLDSGKISDRKYKDLIDLDD